MDIVIEGRYREYDYLTVDSFTGKIKSLGEGQSAPQEPDYIWRRVCAKRRGLQRAFASGAVDICGNSGQELGSGKVVPGDHI